MPAQATTTKSSRAGPSCPTLLLYISFLLSVPNRRGGDENNNGIGMNMRLEAPDLVSSATCPRTMDSSFKADSQISGTKKINGEKTLEEWKPDADDKLEVSLEENDTNGWRAEEMFKGKFVVTCKVRIFVFLDKFRSLCRNKMCARVLKC